MGEFGIGQPVRRKEDVRLLTGQGQFTDDINLAGQASAAFVRSPHANAKLLSIDVAATLAMPGVIAVYTGADLVSAGMGVLVNEAAYVNRDGRPMLKPSRRILPVDQTRFVGECLAMVIAETPAQARDGADAVVIDFETLPAVVSSVTALAPGAPHVWPQFGSNEIVHWEYGERERVEALLATAHKRVVVDLVNNRIAPSPMEPRVVAAEYDTASDQLTVYSPTQGGRRIQMMLAHVLLKMAPEKVRVISRDTGGGFGVRSKMYPETAMVAFAAKTLGRAVKWLGDRTETFVSDYHGRDQINHAEMGLDKDGRAFVLKVETLLNVGAYLSENGVRLPMEGGGRIIPCAYHIPAFYFSVKPTFTNTVCTDTYRGAGRPEANYLMERLMDKAAETFGLSREEIRRRNFIQPAQMPYRTHLGFVIDSGNFDETMQMALDHSKWNSFAERRRLSEAQGKLRGIGLSFFVEGAGSRPIEGMRVRFDDNGDVTVFAGTYSHGQGHATVYSQLVNEFLGVDFERVKLVDGDTASSPETSNGTFGSRSSMVGGVGIKQACEAVIAKGKKIAAHLLQTDVARVTFEAGVFKAQTSSIGIAEVAAAARDAKRLPDGMAPGLDESVVYENDTENFPNGAHVVELEIDPETGIIELLNYVAIDDCGTVLNPVIVHGQVYGGIVQGVGQVLSENIVYDPEGQLLSGTYMDYGMPRAGHLSHIEAHFNVVPAKTNALGVKGAGEAGACGAPPAIVSAVVDALAHIGVRHIDMPLTPERVWRAIQEANAGKAA